MISWERIVCWVVTFSWDFVSEALGDWVSNCIQNLMRVRTIPARIRIIKISCVFFFREFWNHVSKQNKIHEYLKFSFHKNLLSFVDPHFFFFLFLCNSGLTVKSSSSNFFMIRLIMYSLLRFNEHKMSSCSAIKCSLWSSIVVWESFPIFGL